MFRPQHRSLKFPLEKDLKEAQQSLSQIGARLRITAFRPLPAAAPPMLKLRHAGSGYDAASTQPFRAVLRIRNDAAMRRILCIV